QGSRRQRSTGRRDDGSVDGKAGCIGGRAQSGRQGNADSRVGGLPARFSGRTAVPGRARNRNLSGHVRGAAYDNRRSRSVPCLSEREGNGSIHRVNKTMAKRIDRRQFVQTTAVAGVAAASRPLFAQAPAVMTPKSVRPVVVSSSNGNKFKNGGTKTCV